MNWDRIVRGGVVWNGGEQGSSRGGRKSGREGEVKGKIVGERRKVGEVIFCANFYFIEYNHSPFLNRDPWIHSFLCRPNRYLFL